MAVAWELLFRLELGVAAAFGGLGAVLGAFFSWLVAVAKVGKYRAERDKLREEIKKARAETEKIQGENRKTEREELQSRYERTKTCATAIDNSTAEMVNDLKARFSPFAFPAAKITKTKLRELIGEAKRFRQEQAYRPGMAKLIGELSTLAQVDHDPKIEVLRLAVEHLLNKVSEKKVHTRSLEERGLTPEISEAIKIWLSEVIELQVEMSKLVGEIGGRLAGEDDHPLPDSRAA